ncbi:MAG: LD-carboxypeptidase [Acidobacteria bacterium]|nr:LD-carboxypeptidase [Acidobacteriota bacterium]
MAARRTFLKQTIGVSLALAAAGPAHSGDTVMKELGFLKPKRLLPGQTVGVIAPASNAWEDEDIRWALDVVASMGFKTKEGKYLFQRDGYLAGRDEDRAEDVQAMFDDDSVDAIMCLRGGFGTLRMLHLLDYERIAKNAKLIIGFSDITALLNAISAKSRMITFHGPVARQEYSEYTLNEFKRVTMSGEAKGHVLGAPPPFEAGEGKAERENRLIRISPGTAEGQLIGGNLSLMTKLVGTPYEPDYRGKILFLEDVDERPYRIDGMLTHLIVAGRLHQLAGIAFGKCTDCNKDTPPTWSLERVLNDRLGNLGIPVLRGLMIGHIREQTTVPIGAMARLDVDAGQLILLEDPVR